MLRRLQQVLEEETKVTISRSLAIGITCLSSKVDPTPRCSAEATTRRCWGIGARMHQIKPDWKPLVGCLCMRGTWYSPKTRCLRWRHAERSAAPWGSRTQDMPAPAL
jgi:hypothetical protein